MKELKPIGTIEHISLPEYEIANVPAKIDTGADNSAIWASDIKMENGVLTFFFFAPGSVFYRNKIVTTSKFRTATVKNSFGVKQFRFKSY